MLSYCVVTPAPLLTYPNCSIIELSWGKSKNGGIGIKINAVVPKDQYLGIAFGKGMKNVDILFLQGTGDSGKASILWSQSTGVNPYIQSNDAEEFKEKVNDTYYNYTAVRTVDPSLICGKQWQFDWAINWKSSDLIKHNLTGNSYLVLQANCSVTYFGQAPPTPQQA